MASHTVVQSRVFSLSQRWIKVHDLEDVAAVQPVISSHDRRAMHNARDKPEALVDIRDISVGHCDPAHRIVVPPGRARTHQPNSRKKNVGVYEGNQATKCPCDSHSARITATMVVRERN